MLKFLLIIFLFFFVLFRVGGFLFRLLGGNAAQRPKKKTPRDGNVNVDFQPDKEKKKKGYEGGEYVDYEEL